MNDTASVRDSIREACLVAVPEVLETMFFESLVQGPEIGALPASGSLDISRVDFEGVARGHFIVVAFANLTDSLAEAFLGIEERGAPFTNAGLVLGELANMICGNALGRYRPDGIFRLSTPLTRLGRPVAELSEPYIAWVRFPLQGGPLFVGLILEAAG